MASKAPGAGGKKPVGKRAAPVKAVVEKAAADPVVPEPVADVTDVVMPPVPAVEVSEFEVPAPELVVAEAPLAAVAAAEEIIEDTAPQMADTVAKGTHIMETTMEKTQAMFADLNERAKAAVEKNTKLVAEATEFAKGNVEALVESGKIAAKGFETMGQDAAEYSRKSFETATATLKNMSSVKSPADFFKLQSDFVRGAFDSMVAETSKNTEAFIKLAGDAAQPISSRVAVAVEKVKAAA